MMGAVYLTRLTAGELPEASMIHLDFQLLLEVGAQILNILVLFVALYFILYKPLRKFIDSRDASIREQLDNAVQEEARAVELREQYNQKLRDIDVEREEILKKAQELGVTRSDEIIADARREAASIYRRTMEELRMERENQRDEMKQAIIDISVRMAGRFVKLSMDRKSQDEYVEKAMQSLEDSLWYE